MHFDMQPDLKYWEHLILKFNEFGLHLISAIALFFIGRWLTYKLIAIFRITLNRAKVDITLNSFLCNVTSVFLQILLIVTALNILGVPTSSAAAVIGGASLAIGLSLKDQLSNFAAGALIIFFRPFKVGDYIKCADNREGFVREIKIAQTSIRTYANEEIIIPNNMLMSDSIVNKSSLPLWRVQVLVGVDYNCDLKIAKAAILKAALEHPSNIQSPNQASVQVTSLGDSAIEITL